MLSIDIRALSAVERHSRWDNIHKTRQGDVLADRTNSVTVCYHEECTYHSQIILEDIAYVETTISEI
mgnify:CR=1 FL=1